MIGEKKIRSLAKGFSWRVLASLTTFILAYLVFYEDENVIEKAGIITGLEIIAKLILYYLHERAWLQISWGLKKED